METLVGEFKNAIIKSIAEFKSRYPDFVFNVDKGQTPAGIITSFFTAYIQYPQKQSLYVMIDEYDNFANEILSRDLELFKAITSAGGFLKSFYAAIKEATADTDASAKTTCVAKTFITGVSSVSLDSLTSGFNISLNPALQNGMDLSYLRDNDYALEFFIKTTDPFVEIHFKLNSIDSIDDNNNATFCYAYRAGEHNTDGQWERISIPLKEMDIWNPKEDYMKKIDHFNVIVCSESGKDIFLDEIRIRKVLP